MEDKEKKFTGTVRLDGREHSLMMKWQEETENKKASLFGYWAGSSFKMSMAKTRPKVNVLR